MSSFPVNLDDLLRHENGVRALARELVGHGGAAEDLVQETWLAALQQGQSARDLGGWLRGVVRNLARVNARGEGRRRLRERKVACAETSPPVDEILEREAMRRRLSEAVCRLSEPERTTILLRYFEDLPPRTVAERMGVPVETVRTRVKRALAKVRNELQSTTFGDRDTRRNALSLAALGGITPAIKAMGPPIIKGAFVASSTSSKTAMVALVVALLIPVGWWVLRDAHEAIPENGQVSVTRSSETDSSAPPSPLSEDQNEAPLVSEPFPPEPKDVSPTPTEVKSERGRVELTVISGATGQPVAGRRVQLLVTGEPDIRKRSIWKTTDAKGVARFEDVREGLGWLATELGGSKGARIKNGKTSKITLRLKNAFNIFGRVVDPGGRPVSNASVLLGGVGVVDIARPVAQTDAQGNFEISEIVANQSVYLSACAKGFEPSDTRIIKRTRGPDIEVELVLPGPGGGLMGLIRSRSDQEPIFGANILFADKPNIPFKSADGRMKLPPAPRRVHSDRTGRFSLNGLANGKHPLTIRVTGWAPHFGEVTIESGGVSDITIELDRGFSVRGRAMLANNKPAAGAEITRSFKGRSIGMPVTCKADGSFVIENLPLGEVAFKIGKSKAGNAVATLSGLEGEMIEWNPILENGGSIVGRVVDENDEPQAGWQIEGMGLGDGGLSWVMATTDDAGRFTLKPCEDINYRVTAESAESLRSLNKNIAVVEAVRPGGNPLTIRVKTLPNADAWVTGKVVLPSGAIPSEPQMKIRLADGSTQNGSVSASTGRFRLGPLSPLRLVLIFSAPGFPERSVPIDSLQPQENRDLGLVELERGGTLEVTLMDLPSDADPSTLYFSAQLIGQSDAEPMELKLRNRLAKSPPLLPGRYRLQVVGKGVETFTLEVLVEADKTLKADVRLKASK